MASANVHPAAPEGRSLLRSPSVYSVLYQYFASQFTFFIAFSRLLPYLETHYELSGTIAGMYATIPLYCGALANWISGTMVDAFTARVIGNCPGACLPCAGLELPA